MVICAFSGNHEVLKVLCDHDYDEILKKLRTSILTRVLTDVGANAEADARHKKETAADNFILECVICDTNGFQLDEQIQQESVLS